MEKKIEDYLHLYLGCQVVCSSKDFPKEKHTGKMVEVSTAGSNHSPWIQVAFENVIDVYRDSFRCGHSSSNMHHFFFSGDEIKPILRPMAGMTQEEKREYNIRKQRKGYMPQVHADNTLWLLKNGFDIFGLISAGLAIDSTTLIKDK